MESRSFHPCLLKGYFKWQDLQFPLLKLDDEDWLMVHEDVTLICGSFCLAHLKDLDWFGPTYHLLLNSEVILDDLHPSPKHWLID